MQNVIFHGGRVLVEYTGVELALNLSKGKEKLIDTKMACATSGRALQSATV